MQGAGHLPQTSLPPRVAEGAEVTVICSAADRDLVASTVIGCASKKLENHSRDIDVVIDTISGKTPRRPAAVPRPGGIPAGAAEPPDTEQRRPVRHPRRLPRCQARPGAAHPGSPNWLTQASCHRSSAKPALSNGSRGL